MNGDMSATTQTASPFGPTVRELRQAQGRSGRWVATQAGISFAHLSAVERGIHHPTLPVAERIAGGLGVPLAEILAAHGTDQ